MKKDKQWLKEALLELKNKENPENYWDEKTRKLARAQQWAWNNCVDRAYELANQLDEPEVLSEEWIDEHVDYADVRGGTQAFIHVEDLQNLLVPKQEEVIDNGA